jgi:hypothetical protein
MRLGAFLESLPPSLLPFSDLDLLAAAPTRPKCLIFFDYAGGFRAVPYKLRSVSGGKFFLRLFEKGRVIMRSD